MAFINWEEAEKYTSWAMGKNNEPAVSWDGGADGWNRRTKIDFEFSQAQVDACTKVTKDTTVLDACCGAGRTAVLFAKKAKHVYAVDGGENMLKHCKNYADSEGVTNLTTHHIGNWHNVKPGEEFPIANIAVSVIGPPQADVLNFSKFATDYCYFLSYTKDRYMLMITEIFNGTKAEDPDAKSPMGRRPGMPPKDPMISALMDGEHRNHSNLDIPFNILYNHGALPELHYADGAWAYEGKTLEEVYDFLREFGQVDEDKEDIFRANCDKRITKTDSGLYRYAYESQMYVLGWDPKQIKY